MYAEYFFSKFAQKNGARFYKPTLFGPGSKFFGNNFEAYSFIGDVLWQKKFLEISLKYQPFSYCELLYI